MIGSNATISSERENVMMPTYKDCAVWIDANDYPVQTFTNGATITNKGNNGATFVVVGSTLEVQLDGSGNKEFEFNGSYIVCNSSKTPFTQYHSFATNYVVMAICKLGTTSNPDAQFSICGSNAFGSANIGILCHVDNRNAISASERGVRRLITKGSVGQTVFNSIHLNGSYNTEQCLWWNLSITAILDHDYLIKDGDVVSVYDRTRTTANNASSVGTVVAPSSSASTYDLAIGAAGNGTFILATGSTMKQFAIFDELLTLFDIRAIEAYFNKFNTRGNTTIRSTGRTIKTFSDDYVLGGLYAKNADRSKTVLIASLGPNHFVVGSDRDGMQMMSTDDGITWPADFGSAIWTDATKSIMPPYGGYNPATNTLIAIYSKWTTATGTYTDLKCRRSTDGGTTWGSEITITLPVTSPALTFWLAHDQLEACNNGDVAIPLYAFSTTVLYKVYVMRSADDGLNWTFTEVFTSGSEYINESSLGWCGGDDWIMWTRVETVSGGVFKYRQFFSDDDMATWSNQGDTPFGGALFAHPPMLRSFLIDGTRVIEASWVNRLTRRMHCKYALASAIVTNGISEWTAKTTYTIFQRDPGDSQGWESGYPFFIHSRNDLNMEGAWFAETSATTTRVSIQYFNDEIKQTIKTELGI